MTRPDGEPETDPPSQTRVSDQPPAQTRVTETPSAAGETRVAATPPAAETRVAETAPAADTRVAAAAPPAPASPPSTADPIVLDPAPDPALDTSHAEPSAIAMLSGQKPEVLVGAAFAGGLLAAMILRRLGG